MFSKIKKNKDYIYVIFLLFIVVLICFTYLINDYKIKSLNRRIENLSHNTVIKTEVCNQDFYSDNEEILEIEELENNNSNPNINIYVNRWNIQLTQEEIYLLAKIVWLEARNQSQEGQMAVVEVIFNRMIDSYYQGSLTEVICRPGQFPTWDKINTATPTSDIYESIKKVLYGETNILPLDTLYFGRNAHSGRTVVKKIEDHVFSK